MLCTASSAKVARKLVTNSDTSGFVIVTLSCYNNNRMRLCAFTTRKYGHMWEQVCEVEMEIITTRTRAVICYGKIKYNKQSPSDLRLRRTHPAPHWKV